jgi:hypothetical protein
MNETRINERDVDPNPIDQKGVTIVKATRPYRKADKDDKSHHSRTDEIEKGMREHRNLNVTHIVDLRIVETKARGGNVGIGIFYAGWP